MAGRVNFVTSASRLGKEVGPIETDEGVHGPTAKRVELEAKGFANMAKKCIDALNVERGVNSSSGSSASGERKASNDNASNSKASEKSDVASIDSQQNSMDDDD